MSSENSNDFTDRRTQLIDLLRGQGIREDVLAAMGQVPREQYVPAQLRHAAYEDAALPIALEQTISQPFIVALMTQSLELTPQDRVLEIGTGSGYAAAVLAMLAEEVYTVERHPELAQTASERLLAQGFRNVHVRCGDGSEGWPEEAPYQAITVAAASPDAPSSLLDQLAIGGRLVIPIGEQQATQKLVRIRRVSESEFERVDLAHVRFVPLIGTAGWQRQEPS